MYRPSDKLKMSKISRTYVQQLENDLDDLNSFSIWRRCPCCTHLVNDGWVCQICGCDAGVFNGGEYSKEEIKIMKSKK